MLYQVVTLNREISGRDEWENRQRLNRWFQQWSDEHQLGDDVDIRVEQLRQFIYETLAFRGNWEDFYSSDNVLLDQVLEHRRGTSTSLAMIVLFYAEQFDLEATIIALPGYSVVAITSTEGAVYIDPFDGNLLTYHQLELKLRCHLGDLARLTPEHLRPLSNEEMVQRWLVALKSAFIREDDFETALRVSNIILRYKPGDPHEMRDRGFLFQQLDCHNVAINDYEFFIEKCPEDPVSELLKQQVRVLEEHYATIH